MAKLSALPEKVNPTGDETVPILDGGIAKRASIRQLVVGATSPAVLGVGADLALGAAGKIAQSLPNAIRAEAARDITAGYASDAVSQGNVPIYGTRAGIANIRIPAGIAKFTALGYAAVGDCRRHDYIRRAVQPTHPGKVQSEDGAWWELDEMAPQLEMFGGKADCVTSGSSKEQPLAVTSGTDNVQPFYDMVAYLRAKYTTSVMNVPICPFQFGTVGSYYFSTHVNIKLTLYAMGLANSGQAGAMTQRCVFPNGSSGFIVHRGNTIDFQKDLVGLGSGSGTVWSETAPAIVCCGTPALNTRSYGFWMRARAHIINPRIYNFEVGVRLVATAGTSNVELEGNCNGWRITNGRIEHNIKNVASQGADANAGSAQGTDVNGGLMVGVDEASFLGNDYGFIFTDSNNSAIYLSQIHSAGGIFMCMDPSRASTTEPTIATSYPNVPFDALPVWAYKGPGDTTFLPTWVSGTQTFYRGGGVVMQGNNNTSTRVGGYDEPNQPAGYIDARCTVYSGAKTFMMGPGGIIGNTVDIPGTVAGTLIKSRGTGSVPETFRSFNRSPGNRRTRFSFAHGYLPDGVTERVQAMIEGGTFDDAPIIIIGTNKNINDNTVDYALEIAGGALKQIRPGADNVWTLGLASRRLLQAFITKLSFGAGATFMTSGSGSPNGNVSAAVGSLYTRTDGGALTTLYVKETGTGNTGWVAK